MITIGIALGLARTTTGAKAGLQPIASMRALVGSKAIVVDALTPDDAESLDQVLDDARRYGAVTGDVAAMTRQRHAEDGLDLSKPFKAAVEELLTEAEAHPGLRVALSTDGD